MVCGGASPEATARSTNSLNKVPLLLEHVARPLPPLFDRSIVHQLNKGRDCRENEAGREDEERISVADTPHPEAAEGRPDAGSPVEGRREEALGERLSI